MPTYRYRCARCDAQLDKYLKINDRRRLAPVCCMRRMSIVICAPMISPDITGYASPIDGRPIESRRQRTEDFKRNRSRPWEGLEQEKKEAARALGYQEQKEEKVLDRVANETFHQLPPASRKWLTEHS